jgi:hypothetical protein
MSIATNGNGSRGPTKLLRGKVAWIYTCYTNIDPIGHLIAEDVRPLECREVFPSRRPKKPRQFLMAATDFNENFKDLEKEAVILLMAQKCVTRNLWASRT